MGGKICRERAERLLSGLDEIDEQLKAEQQFYKTSALTDLSTYREKWKSLTRELL